MNIGNDWFKNLFINEAKTALNSHKNRGGNSGNSGGCTHPTVTISYEVRGGHSGIGIWYMAVENNTVSPRIAVAPEEPSGGDESYTLEERTLELPDGASGTITTMEHMPIVIWYMQHEIDKGDGTFDYVDPKIKVLDSNGDINWGVYTNGYFGDQHEILLSLLKEEHDGAHFIFETSEEGIEGGGVSVPMATVNYEIIGGDGVWINYADVDSDNSLLFQGLDAVDGSSGTIKVCPVGGLNIISNRDGGGIKVTKADGSHAEYIVGVNNAGRTEAWVNASNIGDGDTFIIETNDESAGSGLDVSLASVNYGIRGVGDAVWFEYVTVENGVLTNKTSRIKIGARGTIQLYTGGGLNIRGIEYTTSVDGTIKNAIQAFTVKRGGNTISTYTDSDGQTYSGVWINGLNIHDGDSFAIDTSEWA